MKEGGREGGREGVEDGDKDREWRWMQGLDGEREGGKENERKEGAMDGWKKLKEDKENEVEE